jgi:threonine/homoserine/homoserine lactone efflux protein
MTIDLWLTFVAASIALLIIPGPTILLVLSYALSHGRKVALATAAGVAMGDLIAMSASLLGLGALILTSATAFVVIKWIGAAYLVWLGIKMLRAAGTAQALGASSHTEQDGPTEINARDVFAHAAAVTALNPKGIGFFIAFVPQFIDASSDIAPQFAILIATFVSLAAINAFAYAWLADHLRSRITRPSVIGWLTRAGGVSLICMGLLTATLRRAT